MPDGGPTRFGVPLPTSVPRLLLLGLLVAVVATVGHAAATSTTDFGVANPAWDGASRVGTAAENQGLERRLAQNASLYRDAGDGTLAVVLAPGEPYAEADVARIRAFLDRGGSLLVASDFRPAANGLLADLGASARVTGLPLRDERRYGAGPAFPRATNVSDGPLTEGVGSLALNHPSSVDPGTPAGEGSGEAGGDGEPADASGGATVLVRSSAYGYLDANRNGDLDDAEVLGRHPVATVEAVGAGRVVVVSDPSAFINVMLDRGDNAVFLQRLLAGHDAVLLDVSHAAGLPPLVRLQLFLEGWPLVQILLGTAGILAVLLVVGGDRRAGGPGTRVRRLVPGLSGPEDSTGPGPAGATLELSAEEVAQAVRSRHPEWDPERVERVTEGIIRRRGIGRGDD